MKGSIHGAPKTKTNILAALKQFFAWAHNKYDIPELKRWPKLGHVEMSFRNTVDLDTQEAIIADIKAHEPVRVWLCIKWLATYIAIRLWKCVVSPKARLTDSAVF